MLTAVVALLLVDIVLVVLALRSTAPDEIVDSGPTFPKPSASPSESESAGPTGSQTGSASRGKASSPSTSSDANKVLLSAGQGGAALRGVVGSCPQGGAQLSARDGEQGGLKPLKPGVRSLLRVRSVDATSAWVVATVGKSCEPRFLRTRDAGRTWERTTSTSGAWHLLPPGASGRLHAPEGPVDSPCGRSAPVDLTSISPTGATALCANGRVWVTATSGQQWTKAGRVRGATAVSAAGDTTYAAAPSVQGCQGTTVMVSTDGSKTWRRRGCAPVTTDHVALSFSTVERGLIATADRLLSTTDGGRTWSKG